MLVSDLLQRPSYPSVFGFADRSATCVGGEVLMADVGFVVLTVIVFVALGLIAKGAERL